MKNKVFSRKIEYIKHVNFDQYIDDVGILILDRFMVFEPMFVNNSQILLFKIKEECQIDIGYILKFTRVVFERAFDINELPKNNHLIITALVFDNVNGVISELFIQSLFHDIILLKNKELILSYFPNIDNEI